MGEEYAFTDGFLRVGEEYTFTDGFLRVVEEYIFTDGFLRVGDEYIFTDGFLRVGCMIIKVLFPLSCPTKGMGGRSLTPIHRFFKTKRSRDKEGRSQGSRVPLVIFKNTNLPVYSITSGNIAKYR